MQQYHSTLRAIVSSAPRKREEYEDGNEEPATMDPKYGRFKKDRRCSQDQVPLPMVVNQNLGHLRGEREARDSS